MKETDLLAKVKEMLARTGNTRLLSLLTNARFELRRICSGYENWAPYQRVELYRLIAHVPAHCYTAFPQEIREFESPILDAANSFFSSDVQEIDSVEIISD